MLHKIWFGRKMRSSKASFSLLFFFFSDALFLRAKQHEEFSLLEKEGMSFLFICISQVIWEEIQMQTVSCTQTDLSFPSKLTLVSCSFLPADQYWLPYQKRHLWEHLWAHPQLLWCCSEVNLLPHGKGLFPQVSEVRSVQGTGEEAPGQESEEMAPVPVRKKPEASWVDHVSHCNSVQIIIDY